MTSLLSRRQCLKMLGILSAAPAVPSLFVEPARAEGCSGHCLSKTLPMMSTMVTITTADASRVRAEQAREKAFAAMRDLIPIFDRFDPNSRISWLNTHGRLRDVPPALSSVLEQAQEVSRLSGNRFDITILPLLDLYTRSLQKTGHPPPFGEVKRVRAGLGMDKIALGSKEVVFSHPGTQITLDGIAKGFIVDAAADVLKQEGIESALINAGGDIRAVGGKGRQPWIIGIQDPSGRRQAVQSVAVSDLAVATSGSYESFFDPLGTHHHLIDSSQGSSPLRTVSATAIASTAASADAWSTAFFLLDPEESVGLAGALQSVQTLVITRGGRTFRTDGWPGRPA